MEQQNKYLPLLLGVCTAIGMVVGLNLPRYDKHVVVHPNRGGSGGNQLVGEVLGYLDAKYVDEIDTLGFDEAAIESLLAKLDPHTTYLSAEEREQTDEEMEGSFNGIGIEFEIIRDTVQVVAPMAGGPADIAGLWAGDRIIKVNDTLVAGVKSTNKKLMQLMRGEKGTTVQVTVQRGDEPTLRTFTIKRDEIPVHSVTAAHLLNDSTAYLKLARFNQQTHQEFVDALLPKAQGRKDPLNLILDLRGNPGGLLDQAVQVLSNLFPKDKLLVYTEGRAEKKRTYESSGRSQINIKHLAVLIDEGSASASEVVAGAIQDHDRGWIVGERSFGKGLVQEQFPLSNGGALRVTVSRYYTPSGRCIQKDYTDRTAYQSEHLLRSDTTRLDTNRVFYTGRGRKVYSNQGIRPDVLVSGNALERTVQYRKARAMMSSFIKSWMETRNESEFPKEAQEWVKRDIQDLRLAEQFFGYSLKNGANWTAPEFAEYRSLILSELKATIARNLYRENGYQMVKNQTDEMVKTAAKLLGTEIK